MAFISKTPRTRAARQVLREQGLYSLDHLGGKSVWWDDYAGEASVLIDDFYGWMPYHALLRITDIYPLRLPVKCGFTYAKYRNVVITSNAPMSRWYKSFKIPDISALLPTLMHLSHKSTHS